MKIAELFAEIGFQVDSEKLDEFKKGLNEGTKGIAIFAAKVAATVFAVKKFTDATVGAAASLHNFRVETGLSANELQRWQNVATFSDLEANANDVTTSISNLQSMLMQIRLGSGNTRPFYMFGVDAGADAMTVLDQLRGKMDMFDESMTVNLLQEMGLGTEMLHVLKLSNQEFDKLAKSYVLSGDQIANVREMGVEFRKLGKQLSFVKDEFVAFLAPHLADAARALSYAVKLIVAPFEAIGFLIQEVFELFGDVGGRIAVVAAAIFGLRKILLPVLGVFGALAAKIVGLLLIIEDVVTGLKGGVSIITELFTLAGVEMINFVLKGMVNLKNTMTVISEMIHVLIIDPIMQLFGLIPQLTEMLPDLGEAFNGIGTIDGTGQIAAQTGAGMNNLSFSNVINIFGGDAAENGKAVGTELRRQTEDADDILNRGQNW